MSACFKCKRDINNGTEGQKAVTVFKLPNGEKTVRNPAEGIQPTPGGKLLAVYHYKCYKVLQKVEKRTADAGSLIGKEGMPTGYQVADLVMNRDEARERGLTIEEAKALTTRAMSERAQSTLHQSIRKGQDLADRIDQRIKDHGMPVGTDNSELLALGATSLPEKTFADDYVEASNVVNAVQVEKEDDPDYEPDKERPGSWPAGGQVDMEV